MKLKNIKAIYNILLPSFPGYEAKGPLLFASPIDQILKGYYIEGSDFDANRFYVWVFVLPLYVPTKYISFNFGKRLTGKSGEYWSFTEPSIEELASDLLKVMRKEGLPFLSAFHRPLDLAPNASRILENPDDPYRREAVAYSLVLAQKSREAIEALDLLNAILAGIDQQRTWVNDMRRRALSVREHLLENPEEAKKLLMRWEQQTLVNLKLKSFSKLS